MRLTITITSTDEKSRDLIVDTCLIDIDTLLVALSLAPEVKEVSVRSA
jgi:hypothetical protein